VTHASTGPLIGRARELECFQTFVEAIRSGSAATLLIEGEAGIGKTRLLTRLIGVAPERRLTVFHGGAHPLERIRRFGILVDALDLRSTPSDPLRAALGRLLMRDVLAAGDLAAGQ
jgi:predicted ATPase